MAHSTAYEQGHARQEPTGSWTVGSLFTGIGGMDLGLERAGFTIAWQVENDTYCRRVLEKRWPHVHRYQDIKDIDWSTIKPVGLLCGGFPCQPVSIAGKRLGTDDPRWLWTEFARAIRHLRPRYALIENVPGLFTNGFGVVLSGLSELGYDAEWQVLSAASFGAPHLRKRVWIVAYPVSHKLRHEPGRRSRTSGANPCIFTDNGEQESVADAESTRLPSARCNGRAESPHTRSPDTGWWAVEPDVGRVAHGVPARVDRLKGLGNAVVPQIMEWIGARIRNKLSA